MKSLIVNNRHLKQEKHHQKQQPQKDLSVTEVALMSSSFIGLSPQQQDDANSSCRNNGEKKKKYICNGVIQEETHQHHQQQEQSANNEGKSSDDDPPPTPTGGDDDDHDDPFIEPKNAKNTNYYRYIIDRTNGTSKLDISKPPSCLCYVPKPVAWFPDWIERNSIFEYLGRKGIFSSSNLTARKYCIGAGLICNIVSAILSFYVLFGISVNYNIIWFAAFTSGTLISGNATLLPYKLIIRMGLNAMAIETQHIDNSTPVQQDMIVFDDVCDILSVIDHVDYGNCAKCQNVSNAIVFSLFVSFFMSFPSITTSVVRLYPHYDCNCQKIFASFAAVIALCFAVYTFVIYQFSCFRSMATGHVCINEDLEFYGTSYYIEFPPPEDDGEYDPDDYRYYNGAYYSDQCFYDVTPDDPHDSVNDSPYYYYYQEFGAGPAWIALAISTGLRILDMLFNMAIPTPTICRDREEQRLYEVLVTEGTAGEEEEVVVIITTEEEDEQPRKPQQQPPLSSSTTTAVTNPSSSKTAVTTTMTSSDKSKDTIDDEI